MATLTAGNFSGTEGYFAGSAGSLSPDTFGGLTCTAILTGITAGRVSVIFAGNAVSFLTGKTITIDGVPYATIATGPTYDGSSQTNIEWTYGGGDFVVGNVYTVDIGTGAPVDPNITSAAAVSNDLGSVLAHSLTADKTISAWTIIGGADAAEFEISGSTLRFAGNAASDTLGDFVVQVRATDTDGLIDEQTITVTVVVPYVGPIWIGKSTAASSASAFNISFASSGRVSGDKLFIAVMTANEAISAPTGFAEVATYSPQFRGTAAVAGGVRLTLFEKESAGTEGTVSIPDSGNIQYAVGFVTRGDGGVDIATGAGNNVAATTSGTFGGVTTPVDGCLVVHIVATDRDSTAQSWSSVANSNLQNLTEQHDAGTTTNTGGGIAIFTGEKQSAGATGNTTATQAASSAFCWITLALKNAASGGTDALAGNSIASGSATIGQGAISVAHLLSGTSLATGTAAIGVATIAQVHALTGASIATSAAALGVPTLNQVHGLAGTGVTTSAASISISAIAIVTLLVGNGLATSAAAIGAGTIGQAHALTSLLIETGAAALGSPALAQRHIMTGVSVATSAAVMGTPTLAQAHPLAGVLIASGAAQIGVGTMTQSYALTAQTIATSAASVGVGAMVQIHGLAGTSIATGAAIVGQGSVFIGSVLSGNSISTGQAAIGTGALAQRHGLGGASIATGAAALGVGTMAQAHVITGTAILTGAGQIGIASINQVIALYGLGLATGPAAIDIGDLAQTHDLAGISLSTGAAEIGIGTMSLSGTLIPNPINTGPASIGVGTVRHWAWHESPLDRRSESAPQMRLSIGIAQSRASESAAQSRSSFSPEQIRATSSVEQRRASTSPDQPRKSG